MNEMNEKIIFSILGFFAGASIMAAIFEYGYGSGNAGLQDYKIDIPELRNMKSEFDMLSGDCKLPALNFAKNTEKKCIVQFLEICRRQK